MHSKEPNKDKDEKVIKHSLESKKKPAVGAYLTRHLTC
jgi:hypothetical protein